MPQSDCEHNNYKLCFKLKQHTPLIHFQANQSGATLRATELKPKFDRFLKEYAFGGSVPEEFLIDKEKDALNYKVKIEQNLEPKEDIPERNSLFFGNMQPSDVSDEEWNRFGKKYYKKSNREFKIEFFSFNTDLLNCIKDNFEAFLANTNFGTRQSKGYGSFYLADKKFNPSLIKADRVYSFTTKNWEQDIKLLYQFLRQGINLPRPNNPFYSKPAIFAYAKSKGWQWDKKSIKEQFFNNKLQQQIQAYSSDVLEYSSDTKYLVRDLFGLSSSQEWMSYNARVEKVHNTQDDDEKIERFKSPITFKVVDNRVYFWVNNTLNSFLDREFKITVSTQNNNELLLSTPPEFDFNDFFDFTFNRLNLATHIEEKFHSTNEYKSLDRILTEIRGR